MMDTNQNEVTFTNIVCTLQY